MHQLNKTPVDNSSSEPKYPVCVESLVKLKELIINPFDTCKAPYINPH